MRRDAGAVWRAATWAIGASIACAGCSRDPAGAAQDGADAVRAALEAGLDPDRPNGDGDALVHVAVRRRDPRMLGAVIARSARIDQRNDRGMTALGLTADELAGSDRTSRRNRDEGTVPGDELALACALELLQAHADPNAAQGPHGDRPLHLAAAAGSPELVEMLLDAGADPNGRSGRGETPLHAAAGADEYRGVAVTRLLVARGADARVTDVLGETPVHKAAERDSVELLLYYAGAGAAAGVDAGADAGVDAGVDSERAQRVGSDAARPRRRGPPGPRDRGALSPGRRSLVDATLRAAAPRRRAHRRRGSRAAIAGVRRGPTQSVRRQVGPRGGARQRERRRPRRPDRGARPAVRPVRS